MRLSLIVTASTILWSVATISFAHSEHDHGRVNQSKKKKAAEGYSQGTIQSKNKKSAHTHSHGTGFSFEVGLSVTKSLGKENSKSESGESAGDDHSGHTNLKLDGDETHSHDGSDSGDGGGTTPPAFDPTLTARLSYKFVPSFGALLLAGYALESGSIDPEAGVAATVSMSKRLIGNATVTASYPASKASQENYKITTIKLTAGPTYNLGRYTFGFAANTAYSWYSKTIIYEDEEGGQSRQLRLLDDGHDHDTAPVSPTDNDLSASDREFSRWGGKGSIGYKIFPRLRFDTSVGASLISRQFGPSTWLTQAMLAQVTYSMRNFSGYGGLLFSKEAASLSVPTVPAINVGVGYKLR